MTFDLCLECRIEFWSRNRSYIPGTNKSTWWVSESLVIIIACVTMMSASFFRYTDVSYRFVLNTANEKLPVTDRSQCARSRGFTHFALLLVWQACQRDYCTCFMHEYVSSNSFKVLWQQVVESGSDIWCLGAHISPRNGTIPSVIKPKGIFWILWGM